jgi:transmembrane sensor
MDSKKFRLKLKKYLKGTANETEKAVVEAWYRSYQPGEVQNVSPNNRQQIKSAIAQKVNAAIGVTPRPSYRFIYRIAATVIMVLCLSALGYYWVKPQPVKESYTVLQTRAGEIKQITLPDSSVVWINAASSLRIPSSFNQSKTRELYLDEGEAFFKVKHNAAKPFRVLALGLRVQVLGTSFNVNAYHKLPFVKVAVATGKVGVSKGRNLLLMLTPGQEFTYLRESGAFNQKHINIQQNQSWKDGDTYLTQANFNELALVFNNLFGLTLKAATPQVSAYQFTIRVHRSLPAEETLKAISLMHNTHFRKEGNIVTLY